MKAFISDGRIIVAKDPRDASQWARKEDSLEEIRREFIISPLLEKCLAVTLPMNSGLYRKKGFNLVDFPVFDVDFHHGGHNLSVLVNAFDVKDVLKAVNLRYQASDICVVQRDCQIRYAPGVAAYLVVSCNKK